jgi:hypothetical protein
MVRTLPSRSLNFRAASSPLRVPESAARAHEQADLLGLVKRLQRPQRAVVCGLSFLHQHLRLVDQREDIVLGDVHARPRSWRTRISWSGFRSMIDSPCAQLKAERSTRKRPEITDTVAPDARHLAIDMRTTSGRNVATRRAAMASALSALAFDRAELQVAGRQSCCATNHRSSSSPTVRKGAARRMDRYSANWAASSRRRSSASSATP